MYNGLNKTGNNNGDHRTIGRVNVCSLGRHVSDLMGMDWGLCVSPDP